MFTTRENWFGMNPYREWSRALNRLARPDIFGLSGGNPYPVNIWSSDDGYVFTAEMPGLDGDSINVEVLDDQLTIETDKKSGIPEGARIHREERGSGKMTQTYKLPFSVAKEKVVAQYQNGILKLILPKSEESKAKKIKIES